MKTARRAGQGLGARITRQASHWEGVEENARDRQRESEHRGGGSGDVLRGHLPQTHATRIPSRPTALAFFGF
jgi:hypothetical protein